MIITNQKFLKNLQFQYPITNTIPNPHKSNPKMKIQKQEWEKWREIWSLGDLPPRSVHVSTIAEGSGKRGLDRRRKTIRIQRCDWENETFLNWKSKFEKKTLTRVARVRQVSSRNGTLWTLFKFWESYLLIIFSFCFSLFILI